MSRLRVPSYTVVGPDLPPVERSPRKPKTWSWDALVDHLAEELPGVWVQIDADVPPRSVHTRLKSLPGVEVALRNYRLCVKVNR